MLIFKKINKGKLMYYSPPLEIRIFSKKYNQFGVLMETLGTRSDKDRRYKYL
jgi:hypothetical protein